MTVSNLKSFNRFMSMYMLISKLINNIECLILTHYFVRTYVLACILDWFMHMPELYISNLKKENFKYFNGSLYVVKRTVNKIFNGKSVFRT